MHAVDGDAGAGQRRRVIKGQHDLGELRLAVGVHAVVVALEHDVVKADRRLTGGGDVDDAARRGRDQQRLELVAEHVRREVVDLEGRLVPILGDAPHRVDAEGGVVEQDVEPIVFVQDALGEPRISDSESKSAR